MKPEIHLLSGVLNTDDSSEVMNATHHKMSKNGRFRGSGNNLRFENIKGTSLIPNTYLPAGNNQCCGAFYDELRNRIFWFNYNSGGLHGIYQFTISTGAIARVALVGYNTDGDIISLDLNNPVYAVKMLYGDTIQGDTLFFNNSLRQPCEINIDFALAGTYGTIKRSFINVIKAPAILPPYAVYGNDNAVTVNNLRKKLHVFATCFRYLNRNKSVLSSRGQMPIPVNYMDVAIDKDPTKNCVINLVVPTGESDVDVIEVIAYQLQDGKLGDPFVIATLNKSQLSIPSNDLYKLQFYNNQAYFPFDIERSLEIYDYVPLKALALEFLNGNVPIYGAITEGYDKTLVAGTSTSGSEVAQTTHPPFIFASSQSGDSGFGTGNIHTVLIGVVVVGNAYNIYTTNQTITFVATVATTANVITGLAAAAVVAGFTVVSSDTENLTIVKTGEVLLRTLAVPLAIAITDSFVYDTNARYNYVIVYFDAEGRTIGSQTSSGMNFQTINYTETTGTRNIPKIGFSISSRPPLYAKYFQIGRTLNLSKTKKIEWISDRTYKDSQFAYISIENLNQFIRKNPNSKFLTWDAAANDRIRFMKNLSGGINTIYTTNDFEILSQEFNPTINGIDYVGQFFKIALPTTSGTFDFGTSGFYNYFIELYTPAQSVSDGLDQNYEFGERYSIGNYGTSAAYHQGMLQNQTEDLVTPATFEFTQGDYYVRNRTIQTGGELDYVITAGEITAGRHTMGVNFVSRTFTDATIITGNSPLQDLSGWTYASNTRAIIRMSGGATTTTFKAKGTISVDPLDDDTFTWFFQKQDGTIIYVNAQRGVTDQPQIFQIDCSFTLAAGEFVSFLGWSEDNYSNPKKYFQTDLEITIDNPFTVTVIDPNFSDYFESKVNSNGRSFIVDINAAQVFNPTLMRWGLEYQPNTNINQVNRFKALNFDEIDRSKGQIQIFKVRDRTLRVFQERGCGQAGIYAKFLQDSGNTNVVTTTDDIITKNNIQYYSGIYGVGNQPTGLVSSKNVDYFIDPVRGYQLRLGPDGLTPISEIYKGQFYIQPKFIPYNDNYVRADGSKAKILGCYNYFEEECISVLQGGTFSGNEIDDYCFSFNEKRNAYSNFFDILNPDWIISANDVIYAWKNGQFYSFTNEDIYCNFFGVQYYPSITLAFNNQVNIKKTFMGLQYEANQKWVCPEETDILTSQPDPQTNLPQISKMSDYNFTIQEGGYYGALQRNINSGGDKRNALVNGQYLKGFWIDVRFTYLGTEFSYIYLPTLRLIASAKN